MADNPRETRVAFRCEFLIEGGLGPGGQEQNEAFVFMSGRLETCDSLCIVVMQ